MKINLYPKIITVFLLAVIIVLQTGCSFGAESASTETSQGETEAVESYKRGRFRGFP